MPDKSDTKSDEVLIRAERISKKYCRSLKRSLWYGVKDISVSLMPWKARQLRVTDPDSGGFKLPSLREDEFWAVHDVSFEVRRGECLGLVGHNGAGKSTLLKMLNSLNRPDSGRITMRGRIGALIELNAGFNPVLTGRENVFNQSALLGIGKKETRNRFDAIVEFSELEDFLDMPVQNYSSGMKVRLGFSIAALMEPDILLLDEVLAVGDMGFTLKCLNRIGEIMPATATIFVSHNMQQVARICNSILLLNDGKAELLTRDVAKGIHAYLSCYSGLKPRELGNGAMALKSVQLSQKEGAAPVTVTSPFENGNTLSFLMEIEKVRAIDERFFVIIKIYDQQLRECVNSYSHDASDQTWETSSLCIKIRADLPGLYLNRGLHYVSISVEGAATRKIYCHATNVISFMVRSKIQGWATSTVPGTWQIIE